MLMIIVILISIRAMQGFISITSITAIGYISKGGTHGSQNNKWF
jgi:hypothetical protein